MKRADDLKRRLKIGQDIAQKLRPWATLEETAAYFKLTPERIRQIESLALYKLAVRLQAASGQEIKL